MTPAVVRTGVTPLTPAGVAVVPSDDRARGRSRPSRGAGVPSDDRRGAGVPLSKEREREGGGAKALPPPLSPSLSPIPRKTAASLAGLIARWCALTDNVPDVTEGETPEGKFEAHLNQLAEEQRRVRSLEF